MKPSMSEFEAHILTIQGNFLSHMTKKKLVLSAMADPLLSMSFSVNLVCAYAQDYICVRLK